jgi:hypothetical protein
MQKACQSVSLQYTHVTGMSYQPNPLRSVFLSFGFNHVNVMWDPPRVKQALPNMRSPWQLQRPLVSTPPSDKSIKKWTSDTLATVTATLTSRKHCNSEPTSSSRLRLRSPALIRRASLTVPSTGQPAATRASPSIQQAHPLAVTELLQGRTPTPALASPLQQQLHPASRRCARIPTNGPFQGQYHRRH